jgi:hypothetical protein
LGLEQICEVGATDGWVEEKLVRRCQDTEAWGEMESGWVSELGGFNLSFSSMTSYLLLAVSRVLTHSHYVVSVGMR